MRSYISVAALAFVISACGTEVDEGAGVMGITGDAPSQEEQAVHNVCPAGSTVFGVDVSYYQGTINWASAKTAGVKYAFIRVADGSHYSDPKFASNWSGAKAHGILRGAYQFFRSDQDPIAQANLLIQKMGTLQPGDLPPVVDVETTDGVSAATRRTKLHQWLDRVQQATGVKPIIYTGGYFWDDSVAGDFHTYPLWHAGYTGGTCPSTVSSHWSNWTLWQYTSSGSVGGIPGNVDHDRYNGTLAQLQNLGVPSGPPPPPPPPPLTAAELEAIYGAALFDAPGVTDIDGDGKADVCARAAAGLVCTLSSGGAPLSVPISTTRFADANGWNDVANYSTLRIGDVTGDGKADVCARANAGIVCIPSTGSGFGATFAGPAFADASGWSKPEYYSTIRLADVDGDGKADLCARAAAGFRCHLSTGSGFGDAIAGTFYADADGFDAADAYGTIRMADIDGDGKLDVCARGPAGLECHRFLGASWGPAITLADWSDAHGFNKPEYWSTLRLADIDGDGNADACIRASDAVHCHLSTGTSFGPDIVGPALADAHGWADDDNYTTIRFGDIDGDGKADLCARANAGARCWPSTGNGFAASALAGPAFFADAGGFTAPESFRTIRLGDVDGDGRADLCGRDTEGFSCFLSTGAAFPTRVDAGRWSDAHGWGKLEYSGTFLLSGAHAVLAAKDGVGDGTPVAAKEDGSGEGAPVAAQSPDDADGVDVDGDGKSGDVANGNHDVITVFDSGCAAAPASTWGALVFGGALTVYARRRRRPMTALHSK